MKRDEGIQDESFVKLTGTIRNYKAHRGNASFVLTQSDQEKMGAIAIAAGLAGLGAQAVATAANATSPEEGADYVEFDLDGRQVKGWVWRSPFRDGDQVVVVGQRQGDDLAVVGIARPRDRTIALYPHCSRGTVRHWLNAVAWWLFGTAAGLAVMLSMMVVSSALSTLAGDAWAALLPIVGISYMVLLPAVYLLKGRSAALALVVAVLSLGAFNAVESGVPAGAVTALLYAAGGVYAFLGLMTFSLARKWMPFVHLAEKAFRAFGFRDPARVDLVKCTKMRRKPDDPAELGTFYFRY